MDPSCKTTALQKLSDSVNNQLVFYNLQGMFRRINSSSHHSNHGRQILYYSYFIREETEAERAQNLAPGHAGSKGLRKDENQGFLSSHHASLSGDTRNVTSSATDSFTLPIKCFMVLTIQLYIKLRLHNRTFTCQHGQSCRERGNIFLPQQRLKK